MKPSLIVACTALTTIFLGPITASASVIEGVTATATSWWSMPDAETPYQAPVNLVNNLGMESPYDITATHNPDGDASGQWHAKSLTDDPNPTLTFDLGGAFDLEAIHIWNGNQGRFGQNNTGRGVNSFTVRVSTDGSAFAEVLTETLTRSPFVNNNVAPINAQSFDLTGNVGITHVQIRVNSVHDPANPYPNLSEVMFTAVEVPGSFAISRFELAGGEVTLAFPSKPGEVFDIYRSVDLQAGLETPLVADLPAAASGAPVSGLIDDFTGGVTLGDSMVDFDEALTAGANYFFIPDDGLNAGREIEVVSWSGSKITLAENIESDLTWSGFYMVRGSIPSETEWVDTAPPAGKAFYQVRRH